VIEGGGDYLIVRGLRLANYAIVNKGDLIMGTYKAAPLHYPGSMLAVPGAGTR
jgi:hypothetical protein